MGSTAYTQMPNGTFSISAFGIRRTHGMSTTPLRARRHAPLLHLHVLAVSTEESPGGHDCHLNFIYALKQRNAKKLDSHAWVVEGIAPALTQNLLFFSMSARVRAPAVRMLVREMQLDAHRRMLR